MEELYNNLVNADRICKQANVYNEKAAEIEQELDTYPETKGKLKKKWILLGIGLAVAADMVARFVKGIPLLYFIIDVGGLAAAIIFAVASYRAGVAALDGRMKKVRALAARQRAAADRVLQENAEALNFLPSEYWYPMATTFLVKAIGSRRVASLGAAMDLFDAQLHRWKMEETNANILAQQQAQTEHLKSIRKTSKINAAANVASAFANTSMAMDRMF